MKRRSEWVAEWCWSAGTISLWSIRLAIWGACHLALIYFGIRIAEELAR